MKPPRATATTGGHHDRSTASAAAADVPSDEALEAEGRPTFGLLHDCSHG